MRITTKSIRQVSGIFALLIGVSTLSLTANALTLNEAIRAAYEHVPAIEAQEHFIAASAQQINLAKSSRRLNVLVEGSKTYGEYVLGNNSYGANLNLSWDLYKGGANKAALAQSRSELSAEMKNFEELLRIAQRGVQSALVALSSTEKQLTYVETEQVASKAVYEAYQQQLITARRSPLGVFVVLNNYNQSTLRAIDTRYQVTTEQYEVIAGYGKLNQFLRL